MVPPWIWVTGHPWWVQIAENALNSPDFGWVTTIFWLGKILPLPTGISDVLMPPAAPPPPAPEEPDEEPVEPLVLPDAPELDSPLLLLPHAASSGTASPAAAIPPRT